MVSEKMRERAENLQMQLATQAQAKYLKWMMKELEKEEGEPCTIDEAWAIVEGRTEPVEYEYMLGFKLADPVIQLALFKQRSREARKQAAYNFAQGLTDEEKRLFYEQIFNEDTAESWRKTYKAERRKAKKGKTK